jgi:hypothetical protein
MARHHNNLMKTMIDEQRDVFEQLDDCWNEYADLAELNFYLPPFRTLIRTFRQNSSKQGKIVNKKTIYFIFIILSLAKP